MEKNNWKMTNKFFEIEISSDKIFGNKEEINMTFKSGLNIFTVPKNDKGKLQVISLVDCIFGKYGKEGQDFSKDVRETAEAQGELFKKAVDEFESVETRFIFDINRQRKEAGLSAV